MIRRLAVLPAAVFILISVRPAAAQTAGQDRSTIGASKGSQTFTVKGHFSVFGGLGLDLDVLGDVTAPAVGSVRGTSVAVQSTAFPDVYVATPRRRYLGASFGFKRKTEIMARYQEARNPASTIEGAATFASKIAVSYSDYRDRMFEFGLRHYMSTPKRSRQYFSLLYGVKTVDAIAMSMRPPGGAAPAALYSRSRVPSIGMEFGVSLEYGHIAVFLESGVRWQKRLTRDDTELVQYQLEDANNTGARIFMPATLGLHFRF